MCPTDREIANGEADRHGCTPFEPRLEAYLDGDLERSEWQRLTDHLAVCEHCRRDLELARSLRAELRRLPSPDLPPEVVARVLSVAPREEPESARTTRRGRPAGWGWGWRPAPVVALATALVVAAILIVPRLGHDAAVPGAGGARPRGVDAAEIAQASAEARLALAYVSTVSRRTGERIRDDLIGRRVIGTTAQELRSITGIEPAAQTAEEESKGHEI